MWDIDLNDKSWMIGNYVKQKPKICFGENQNSDDLWVVKEVKGNKIICDQFTSFHPAFFQRNIEFNINEVTVIYL